MKEVSVIIPCYNCQDFVGETLESLAKDAIPLGRLGMPQEIAEAIVFLAESGYTTGQVLTSDGGFII